MLVSVAVQGCSKKPAVLEIPELGMSITIADAWHFADPAESENPYGFAPVRVEEVGPHRFRVAKQPNGGTEIVYVTGTFPLPNLSILGYPDEKSSPATVEDCAARELEQPFDSVSWKVGPSTLTVPGAESSAAIADYQTRAGADLRTEILVVAKDGRCYVFKATTAQGLWSSQRSLLESALSSVRPL
jgi:hypothetical protein